MASGGDRVSAAAEEIGHIHLPLPSAVQVSHVENAPESKELAGGSWQTWTHPQRGKESSHMNWPPRNPFEEYLLRSLAQRELEPPSTPVQSE